MLDKAESLDDIQARLLVTIAQRTRRQWAMAYDLSERYMSQGDAFALIDEYCDEWAKIITAVSDALHAAQNLDYPPDLLPGPTQQGWN